MTLHSLFRTRRVDLRGASSKSGEAQPVETQLKAVRREQRRAAPLLIPHAPIFSAQPLGAARKRSPPAPREGRSCLPLAHPPARLPVSGAPYPPLSSAEGALLILLVRLSMTKKAAGRPR